MRLSPALPSKLAIAAVPAFFLGILIALLTPLRNVALIEPSIDDIDPQQFYAEFTAHPEKFSFIDVRPKETYEAVHAIGSVSMPLHTLYDEWRRLPGNVSGKTIVLICGGGRASGVGYHYLEHHGFLNLKRIAGGIEAWQLAGLPVKVQN
ncbi:MAG: rhodanese-like domain-containing protein [Candidatus Sungbacteria bacterium]|nr:rhodanese-like domain-containing protein [Candidatus Sungbacteria bacterium]